jgi:hypothetical protein
MESILSKVQNSTSKLALCLALKCLPRLKIITMGKHSSLLRLKKFYSICTMVWEEVSFWLQICKTFFSSSLIAPDK